MADISEIQKGQQLYNIKDKAAREQLATKQEKIETVNVIYTEDGGNPDATADFSDNTLDIQLKNLKLKFSDLTAEERQAITGPQGPQGDSAVYDPSLPDTPDFVMANTTGQSTTKAMTQKAVTDELDKKASVGDNDKYDLDIVDEYGFVLARFSDGHIKTKHFNSKIERPSIDDVDDNADLNISDEEGNVLAKFYNGHIKTKSFDSAQVNIYRPYQRVTRFSYTVDCNPTIKKDFATPTELSSYTQKMLYTDNAVLYLPASYSVNGTPAKLIIYCKHGASEINYAGDPIMDSADKNVFRYLLSLGYAILGADGVPDAFASAKGICERVVGNYIAVQSIRKAYNYVTKWYNIEKHGAYIYGYSQGGHYAQNVIDLSGINIIAAAEVSPVCSMRYHQWDLNAAGTIGGVSWTKLARLNVARLFGFDSVSTNQELLDLAFDQAKVQGYDPWTRNVANPYEGFDQGSTYGSQLWKLPVGTSLSDITMAKSLKCPLKIWCAENDNALGADVMKVFIQAAKNAGCIADMHLYSSGAHSIQTSQAAVSTFTENGDICNLYPLAYEIALWYGQFGGYDIQ